MGWTAAGCLVALYLFSAYQRANGWRLAPDLHIVVLSEPLGTITRGIAGDVADVQVLPYPLAGTGDKMRAERLLDKAHVLIVPRLEDTGNLPKTPQLRLVSMEDVFPNSFQYPVLINNKQFFTYASQELQDKVVMSLQNHLVDMDVVRAGKYEVAAKKLRDHLKKMGTLEDFGEGALGKK